MNKSKVIDPRSWKKWRNSGAISGFAQSPAQLAGGNLLLEKVLVNNLVQDVIDEAVGNWTRRHYVKRNPWIKNVLLSYAKVIAEKVFNGYTPYPDFTSNWKKDVSSRVYYLLDIDGNFIENIQISIILEKIRNMFDNIDESSVTWSLVKIANYVGCTAYMVTCGLEPDLLESTDEEVNESLLRDAKVLSGKKPILLIITNHSI